jgi:hypothetical protein
LLASQREEEKQPAQREGEVLIFNRAAKQETKTRPFKFSTGRGFQRKEKFSTASKGKVKNDKS